MATAAMFVDGSEFVLVLAQLDAEGNNLTKFKKKSDQWSWRKCDNKKCLKTDSWTDRRTPESFSDRKNSPSGLRPEELIMSKRSFKRVLKFR